MDLNQSELNQNQSDSENSLEEEDEPPIDFKSSAQIRFESLLLKRFAKGCLLISFVLFIGQIVVSSTYWGHRQQSSILTGFCFSFLLFFTWLSIMSIFSDSLPQKIKNYLISNLTDASFCGIVINIKPMESNDLLEESGQPNNNEVAVPIENIVTSQILLETLLRRIGNCCLVLSVILFLGQIINASVEWDLAASSVITGFGFSILLFMSWACIDSVYGKGASEGRLTWCQQQISFRFRIHSIEEMKLKMPKGWLTFFTIIYFIVGFSIAISQALILSNGSQSTRWSSEDIIGARFAYAAVLIMTGMFCIILMSSQKKRTSTFFCFLFAVASLVLASIGSSRVMDDMNRGNFEPRYAQEFLEHKSRLDMNSEGTPYFLGWWTLETLIFHSFQLLIVAISAALICICINLWFHIRLVPKSNESDRKCKYMFFIIGVVLMISGFVINVGSVIATKILTPSTFNTWLNWTERIEDYFTLPFACLSLYLTGLLSLSIASSYRVTRGLVLFLFSFVAMGSTIYCLYQSVQMYDKAFGNAEGLYNGSLSTIDIDWSCKSHYRSYYNDYEGGETKCPGSITQNSTDFCLKWKSDAWNDKSAMNTTTCVPIEKKCDGILDFVPPPGDWRIADHFNTKSYYLQNGAVLLLGDELFCAQRYISIYISIFGAAGIAIILTVAIWVMTFDTIGFFGKLITAAFKQKFFSHVPLVSS